MLTPAEKAILEHYDAYLQFAGSKQNKYNNKITLDDWLKIMTRGHARLAPLTKIDYLDVGNGQRAKVVEMLRSAWNRGVCVKKPCLNVVVALGKTRRHKDAALALLDEFQAAYEKELIEHPERARSYARMRDWLSTTREQIKPRRAPKLPKLPKKPFRRVEEERLEPAYA